MGVEQENVIPALVKEIGVLKDENRRLHELVCIAYRVINSGGDMSGEEFRALQRAALAEEPST